MLLVYDIITMELFCENVTMIKELVIMSGKISQSYDTALRLSRDLEIPTVGQLDGRPPLRIKALVVADD